MHSQKLIKTYIFLAVILSVCLAKFFWGWIDVGYGKEFEISGEYSKFKYNPINETIRYVTFISLPLIVATTVLPETASIELDLEQAMNIKTNNTKKYCAKKTLNKLLFSTRIIN